MNSSLNSKEIFLACALFLLCLSCKKNKDVQSSAENKCDLLAEIREGQVSFSYQYDLYNRLIKEIYSNNVDSGIVTIEYKDGGNTIIETSQASTITYALNNKRQLISKYELYKDTTVKQSYFRELYEYDENNTLLKCFQERKASFFDGTIVIDRDTLLLENTVVNLNVVKSVVTRNGSVYTITEYTFDETRPNDEFDPRPYLKVRMDFPFLNKNLLTGIKIQIYGDHPYAYEEHYTYTFDAKGRITRLSYKREGSTYPQHDLNYTYMCN